jgi:tungstate transport system permease protein
MPLGAFPGASAFPWDGRSSSSSSMPSWVCLPSSLGLTSLLLLSRSGPFGFLGILFTPRAMIVAQRLLVLPIVITRQTVEDLWMEYRDELTAMRVGPLRA